MTLPTVDELRAEAGRIGFAACGVATLEPSAHGDALDRWLAAGRAGTMRYLHRQAARRKSPAAITPGARTAVVVLENYTAPPAERAIAGERYHIAAYARGADYHRVTMARLDELAAWMRARGASLAHPWLDAGPVPERELARRAGLGWIGKNTMLIHPRVGLVHLHRHHLHRSRPAGAAPDGGGPLRQLHPVSRRLPHRRNRGRPGARRHAAASRT